MATELITNPFISEIKPGQRIVGFFVVAQATLEPFKSKPGNFLNLTLSDKTGRISAKVWENAPDNIAAGMVVKVAADAKEYSQRLPHKRVACVSKSTLTRLSHQSQD